MSDDKFVPHNDKGLPIIKPNNAKPDFHIDNGYLLVFFDGDDTKSNLTIQEFKNNPRG